MNREEIDRLMADYLGNETDEADRKRFEAEMTRNPDLAAEVGALTSTLETMRFAKPGHAPDSIPALAKKSLRRRGWSAGLRYAAAMIIAFFAGYVSYSFIHDSNGLPNPEKTHAATDRLQEGKSGTNWEDTFAASYMKQQGHSPLARSWIAISRAMHD